MPVSRKHVRFLSVANGALIVLLLSIIAWLATDNTPQSSALADVSEYRRVCLVLSAPCSMFEVADRTEQEIIASAATALDAALHINDVVVLCAADHGVATMDHCDATILLPQAHAVDVQAVDYALSSRQDYPFYIVDADAPTSSLARATIGATNYDIAETLAAYVMCGNFSDAAVRHQTLFAIDPERRVERFDVVADWSDHRHVNFVENLERAFEVQLAARVSSVLQMPYRLFDVRDSRWRAEIPVDRHVVAVGSAVAEAVENKFHTVWVTVLDDVGSPSSFVIGNSMSETTLATLAALDRDLGETTQALQKRPSGAASMRAVVSGKACECVPEVSVNVILAAYFTDRETIEEHFRHRNRTGTSYVTGLPPMEDALPTPETWNETLQDSFDEVRRLCSLDHYDCEVRTHKNDATSDEWRPLFYGRRGCQKYDKDSQVTNASADQAWCYVKATCRSDTKQSTTLFENTPVPHKIEYDYLTCPNSTDYTIPSQPTCSCLFKLDDTLCITGKRPCVQNANQPSVDAMTLVVSETLKGNASLIDIAVNTETVRSGARSSVCHQTSCLQPASTPDGCKESDPTSGCVTSVRKLLTRAAAEADVAIHYEDAAFECIYATNERLARAIDLASAASYPGLDRFATALVGAMNDLNSCYPGTPPFELDNMHRDTNDRSALSLAQNDCGSWVVHQRAIEAAKNVLHLSHNPRWTLADRQRLFRAVTVSTRFQSLVHGFHGCTSTTIPPTHAMGFGVAGYADTWHELRRAWTQLRVTKVRDRLREPRAVRDALLRSTQWALALDRHDDLDYMGTRLVAMSYGVVPHVNNRRKECRENPCNTSLAPYDTYCCSLLQPTTNARNLVEVVPRSAKFVINTGAVIADSRRSPASYCIDDNLHTQCRAYNLASDGSILESTETELHLDLHTAEKVVEIHVHVATPTSVQKARLISQVDPDTVSVSCEVDSSRHNTVTFTCSNHGESRFEAVRIMVGSTNVNEVKVFRGTSVLTLPSPPPPATTATSIEKVYQLTHMGFNENHVRYMPHLEEALGYVTHFGPSTNNNVLGRRDAHAFMPNKEFEMLQIDVRLIIKRFNITCITMLLDTWGESDKVANSIAEFKEIASNATVLVGVPPFKCENESAVPYTPSNAALEILRNADVKALPFTKLQLIDNDYRSAYATRSTFYHLSSCRLRNEAYHFIGRTFADAVREHC